MKRQQLKGLDPNEGYMGYQADEMTIALSFKFSNVEGYTPCNFAKKKSNNEGLEVQIFGSVPIRDGTL